MDRYAVIGHPIKHSKSPIIHTAFARQTQQELSYQALLAPLDGFSDTVQTFRAGGGRGLNVTVPFKLEACMLATRLTARAEAAGAVNTLTFNGDIIVGDNTDGVGLVRDLIVNLACPPAGRRVLLLGAGGAARGVILPLLQAKPSVLTIANRTVSRARDLRAAFVDHVGQALFTAGGFEDLEGWEFDIVINATSASLENETPPLPDDIFAPGAFAYDMMYSAGDTPFLAAARAMGVTRLADGLGMLVEQAAESFALWRGVRPNSASVLSKLRRKLAAPT
ncbi:MAG: shikimate dehydrogenase [Azoarcus sp.]|jgi:shikimate dehydrogenase|nr:shikimate dehydrogenase [Azoarcus sp.]